MTFDPVGPTIVVDVLIDGQGLLDVVVVVVFFFGTVVPLCGLASSLTLVIQHIATKAGYSLSAETQKSAGANHLRTALGQRRVHVGK